jgi:hypothetical protein
LHSWNRIAQDGRITTALPSTSPPTIKWAAQLAHVREVSLRGEADLAFWTQYLAPQRLAPLSRNDRAQILIISADARFRGVRFREVSFSVLVVPPDPSLGNEAAYLLGAFNSNRFFTWCERTLFSTPYTHANVEVSTAPPGVRVSRAGATLFQAWMSGEPPATTARSAPRGFEGPVLLPRRQGRPAKYFIARLAGDTTTLPAGDQGAAVSIIPTADAPLLQALLDSLFVPTEWHVRPDATHAKSKTYSSDDLPRGRNRALPVGG